ncbi:YdcF family protein [Leptolyngbya sp. Heron Island J]|uniref:YdcF family protein n=1 Tax=Leptolyngbya sp. Heron Island J TaxID=1385935 RepID=UPI0009DE9B97|nr:YdcF family protein [Leptolyngbya sp. Heron Island J]
MHCPRCNHSSVQPHGAQAKFPQPYQCKACQHIFYPSVRQALRWLVSILLVVGLSPWWINRGLRVLVTQPDKGESVDAIVVLGSGTGYNEQRAKAAVELWKAGRAPHIFMSGAHDAPILVDLAQKMGVPAAQLSGEACAATTWENAFYTKRYMALEQVPSAQPKILLVTDGLHTGRSTLLYRNFGFEVVSHPVRLEFSQWRKHIIREFLAIMYYVKTKKLLPPTPDDYQRADATAEKRVVDWQCLDMEKAFIPENR